MTTILITGGFGGLGRLVARHLAGDGAPTGEAKLNLILVGRSGLDADKRAFVATLEAEGAQVEAVSVDISQSDALRDALATARERFGPIHGLLHAAGIGGHQRLMEKSIDAFQAVLDPKIAGTETLDAVLADEPLRFVCYFSSTSAVLGDFGSCDYAVANRFLMAYARHRETLRAEGKRQGRTLVVAWPLWRDGGMGFDDEQATSFYLKTSGQRNLETAEGLALLDRLLWQEEATGAEIVFAGEPNRIHRMLGIDAPAPTAIDADADQADPQRRSAVVRRFPEPGLGDAAASAIGVGTGRRPDMRAWTVEQCLGRALREPIVDILRMPIERLEKNRNLSDFGFDSVGLGEYARALSDAFGVDVTPDVFFGHSTLSALSDYFLDRYGPRMAALFGSVAVDAGDASASDPTPPRTVPAAAPVPAETGSDATGLEGFGGEAASDPIAVIGMSGRFPGARDVDGLWDLLWEGRSAVQEIGPERFDWRSVYDPAGGPGRTLCKWMGAVPGAWEFDPLFFEISPREAEAMDPRQRLLLQEAWNALEDSGYGPGRVSSDTLGMFVGVEEGDFVGALGMGETGDAAEGAGIGMGITATHSGVLAARLSYFLGLDGPVMALNTACSSGLVAVHQACQSLRLGECDSALAAGVSLLLTPAPFVGMSAAGMLSPDGVCRALDGDANGIVPGEGVAVVHLKRLSRALADGDAVRAVLLGSGVNYDGRTNGITAPSGVAQRALLRRVRRSASAWSGDIGPRLGHVVTHGTGTPLGDPVEINALAEAYGDAGGREGTGCALTSTKSSLGHGFAASGLVSLIALIQSLEHRRIPASLHCRRPSEHMRGQGFFRVSRERGDWPAPADGGSRVGAVSAFGMSGTNAHVLVAEAPDCMRAEAAPSPPPAAAAAPYQLLVLSAQSPEALRLRATALADALGDGLADGLAGSPADGRQGSLASAPLARVAHALLDGRHPMRHRAALVVRTAAEAVSALKAVGTGGRPDRFEGSVPRSFEETPGLRHTFDALIGRIKHGESAGEAVRDDLCAVADLFRQGYDLTPEALFGPWHPPVSGCLAILSSGGVIGRPAKAWRHHRRPSRRLPPGSMLDPTRPSTQGSSRDRPAERPGV